MKLPFFTSFGYTELVLTENEQVVLPPLAGKILEIIQANDTITIAQLADILGVGHRTLERHIAALRREGVLERTGPAKGGKWELLA